MSKVGVIFNVYAEEGKFDQVSQGIKAKLNPASMDAQDVAFGIKILKVFFTFDDDKTSSSKIEDSIKEIPGVSQVEVSEESLI
ncbi:MAG: hypothetical protein M1544_00675 [Candidatus Marsarchaeota archaeon]|nr:hypothetical protein [Candidatus Marsarchaeota archaeon]MCL5101858.1 hypothetical protein [Candidatus Marsarchaeota archaeon]